MAWFSRLIAALSSLQASVLREPSLDALDLAESDGADAFEARKSHCPYRAGPLREAWLSGWAAANRRSAVD